MYIFVSHAVKSEKKIVKTPSRRPSENEVQERFSDRQMHSCESSSELIVTRSVLWANALDPLLPHDAEKRLEYQTKLRSTYRKIIKAVQGANNDDLSLSNQQIFNDIDKDLYRTRPTEMILSTPLNAEATPLHLDSDYLSGNRRASINEPKYHYDVLARVLFMIATTNKSLGYIQGMNEVCAIIYLTFLQSAQKSETFEDIEADTFFCFNHILNTFLHDSFIAIAEGTVSERMHTVEQMIMRKDSELKKRMNSMGIRAQDYALPWVLLLFAQELSIEDCQLMWDFLILKDDKNKVNLLDHVCVAITISLRDEILADDEVNAMNWLNRAPFYYGVDHVLQIAEQLLTSVGEGFFIPFNYNMEKKFLKEKRIYADIFQSDLPLISMSTIDTLNSPYDWTPSTKGKETPTFSLSEVFTPGRSSARSGYTTMSELSTDSDVSDDESPYIKPEAIGNFGPKMAQKSQKRNMFRLLRSPLQKKNGSTEKSTSRSPSPSFGFGGFLNRLSITRSSASRSRKTSVADANEIPAK